MAKYPIYSLLLLSRPCHLNGASNIFGLRCWACLSFQTNNERKDCSNFYSPFYWWILLQANKYEGNKRWDLLSNRECHPGTRQGSRKEMYWCILYSGCSISFWICLSSTDLYFHVVSGLHNAATYYWFLVIFFAFGERLGKSGNNRCWTSSAFFMKVKVVFI